MTNTAPIALIQFAIRTSSFVIFGRGLRQTRTSAEQSCPQV